MKHRRNRIVVLMLVFSLVFSLISTSVMAYDSTAEHKAVSSKVVTRTEVYVNPLYEDLIDESDLKVPRKSASAPAVASEIYVSEAEAGVQLREQMKQRKETVTIFCRTDHDISGLARRISNLALAHTGVPTEGDYLRWQYGGWGAGCRYTSAGGVYNVELTYTLTYYTTSDQEAKIDTEATNLLKQLDLNGKSDYEKVKGIYDYICSNISYDNKNLNDSSHLLKYTAYAALVNKTAVCQGYAVLFYRLALELGVDARLISGLGDGGPHAWDIVKINGKYYNLDATWDAGRSSYSYFLKGSSDFAKHTSGSEYNTKEFLSEYPVSDNEITKNEIGHKHTLVVDKAVKATCTKAGKTAGSHCSVCGDVIEKQLEIKSPETVTLSKKSQVYNGKVFEPGVTVKDTAGNVIAKSNYTVAYSEKHINAGVYKVTVTFKGNNYSGQLTGNYSITKASQTITASNKTKTIGDKEFSLGAQGKTALSYTSSDKKVVTVSNAGKVTIKGVGTATITITAKADTNYEKASKKITVTVNPKGADLSGLRNSSSKEMTVTWKKNSAVTGYEVQYSTSSKFSGAKTVKIKSNKTTKTTISKLTKGKTYYVRIRTYKTVAKETYNSGWSSAKNVKISK